MMCFKLCAARFWTVQFSQRRLLASLSSHFNNKISNKLSANFAKHILPSKNNGLFEIKELQDAGGFKELEYNVHVRAKELVNECISPKRKRKLVQVFDDLSDELCRVADMADFVRIAHPREEYREAADRAWSSVSTLVQQMNTNIDLYKSLKQVVEYGDNLTDEVYDKTDVRVSKLLLDDFEQCGIHLPDEKREEFVRLNQTLMHLENLFQHGCQRETSLTKSVLPEHCYPIFNHIKEGSTVTSSYSEHPDESMREAAFRAYYNSEDTDQSHILDQLLLCRYKISQLVGYNSYAERTLLPTMTKSPENARKFLDELSTALRPLADEDFKQLGVIKRALTGEDTALQMWDTAYCSAMAKKSLLTSEESLELSSYFSLGACMNGLSMVVDKLFNISLHVDEKAVHSEELWHPSVTKLVVTCNSSDEVLGYIYCDFMERRFKPQNMDCHFTVQGGRRLNNGSYQKSKVVLMMSFTDKGFMSGPALLTPQQVDNLFHEFGHALHSMLGRTRYQHVTGTRCSTDFAEVPSILMEYFSSDPRVLRKFARHYKTGETIPNDLAEKICRSKYLFTAADSQLQVYYSQYDLKLHSQFLPNQQKSSLQLMKDVQSQYYSLPYVENTPWYLRFNHLLGYGSKYFSYLISKSIAAHIWQTCFKNDPLNRTNGTAYRKEVLSHGGEREPTHMIQSLTGTKLDSRSLVDSYINEIKFRNYNNQLLAMKEEPEEDWF